LDKKIGLHFILVLHIAPDGRRPGRATNRCGVQNLQLTVAGLRRCALHRQGAMWLSGAREARSETRRAQGFKRGAWAGSLCEVAPLPSSVILLIKPMYYIENFVSLLVYSIKEVCAISRNGRRFLTLRRAWARRNVAERSERMRAERSPRTTRIQRTSRNRAC
jgi:hypothetical protein